MQSQGTDLQKIFDEIDDDSSGSCSADELSQALVKFMHKHNISSSGLHQSRKGNRGKASTTSSATEHCITRAQFTRCIEKWTERNGFSEDEFSRKDLR